MDASSLFIKICLRGRLRREVCYIPRCIGFYVAYLYTVGRKRSVTRRPVRNLSCLLRQPEIALRIIICRRYNSSVICSSRFSVILVRFARMNKQKKTKHGMNTDIYNIQFVEIRLFLSKNVIERVNEMKLKVKQSMSPYLITLPSEINLKTKI